MNIFTFLRENKVFLVAKEHLLALIADKKDDVAKIVGDYVKDKSPAAKELILTFIMTHVNLKFPYTLFKGKIKKVLDKNFDKVVELILAKLQEV